METPINKPDVAVHRTNPISDIFRRSAFLRRILAFLIVPATILGPIIGIMWLVLRPEAPDFWLDSFSLANFTVVAAANNRSNITFASGVELTSRNPNKRLSLSYVHLDAFVFYESQMISNVEVPPFSQGTKSNTRIAARFSPARDSVRKVVVDSANGSVVLTLRMLSRIRFKNSVWATRHRYLNVLCGDLVVGVPSGGRPGGLAGGRRWCRAEI